MMPQLPVSVTAAEGLTAEHTKPHKTTKLLSLKNTYPARAEMSSNTQVYGQPISEAWFLNTFSPEAAI